MFGRKKPAPSPARVECTHSYAKTLRETLHAEYDLDGGDVWIETEKGCSVCGQMVFESEDVPKRFHKYLAPNIQAKLKKGDDDVQSR